MSFSRGATPLARLASKALRSAPAQRGMLLTQARNATSGTLSATAVPTKAKEFGPGHVRGSPHSESCRFQSSEAVAIFEDDEDMYEEGLRGDLIHVYKSLTDGDDRPGKLIGTTASVRRTFRPGSNAKALLTCGGDELARYASFDPVYSRAQGWVRQHAVGPAVLSPVLISGLVGALVEAALPHSIPMSSSMQQVRPLIVGAEVCAKIVVDAVGESGDASIDSDMALLQNHRPGRTNGWPLQLRTEVVRLQDNAIIAQGTHTVWVPDYMHM